MSKYLKGSKRLAIIQRWLQGIDDPNYDVLPTKKEGKYIVKKKQQPEQQADDEDEPQEVEPQEEQQEVEPQPEQEEQQESPPPQPKPPVKKLPQPPVRKLPQAPVRKPIQRNRFSQQPQVDSTVNLEILEQLKLLGDEIRTKRERKEQKQLIKQVVQKQLRTQPPPMNESHVIAKSKPVEEYEYYSDDDEQPVVFKSRIFH